MVEVEHPTSRFGERTHSRQLTDHYLTDEALDSDPRQRGIDAAEKRIVREVIDALPDGSLVADVPCGNGRMSQWVFNRPTLRLLALDLNMPMLQSMTVRGYPPTQQGRIQANVLALPLRDKCVDLTINMRLMHHIPDMSTRIAMLRQMARITRSTVITSFWQTHCWRYIRRRLRGKTIRGFPISPAAMTEVCQQAGLRVERIVPVKRYVEEQCLVICSVV